MFIVYIKYCSIVYNNVLKMCSVLKTVFVSITVLISMVNYLITKVRTDNLQSLLLIYCIESIW